MDKADVVIMINFEQIQKEISEHENKPLTAENCKILSSLYIIKEHLNKGANTEPKGVIEPPIVSPPPKSKDVNDNIFKTYTTYVQTKKDYQVQNVTKEKLLYSLEVFSQELKDFFAKLYRNTDTPEEREIIARLIDNISVGDF